MMGSVAILVRPVRGAWATATTAASIPPPDLAGRTVLIVASILLNLTFIGALLGTTAFDVYANRIINGAAADGNGSAPSGDGSSSDTPVSAGAATMPAPFTSV